MQRMQTQSPHKLQMVRPVAESSSFQNTYGFQDQEVVEHAMLQLVEKPVVPAMIGLAACLDWLCLHVDNDLLPPSLKEHKAKEGLKVGKVVTPQPGSRPAQRRTAAELASTSKVRTKSPSL